MALPEQFQNRMLLTGDEVCQLAGRSLGWLQKARAAGHIHAVQIGRRAVGFKPADVDALLTQGIQE